MRPAVDALVVGVLDAADSLFLENGPLLQLGRRRQRFLDSCPRGENLVWLGYLDVELVAWGVGLRPVEGDGLPYFYDLWRITLLLNRQQQILKIAHHLVRSSALIQDFGFRVQRY